MFYFKPNELLLFITSSILSKVCWTVAHFLSLECVFFTALITLHSFWLCPANSPFSSCSHSVCRSITKRSVFLSLLSVLSYIFPQLQHFYFLHPQGQPPYKLQMKHFSTWMLFLHLKSNISPVKQTHFPFSMFLFLSFSTFINQLLLEPFLSL